MKIHEPFHFDFPLPAFLIGVSVFGYLIHKVVPHGSERNSLALNLLRITIEEIGADDLDCHWEQ